MRPKRGPLADGDTTKLYGDVTQKIYCLHLLTVKVCSDLFSITYRTACPHFSEDSKLENFRAPSPPPPPKISSIEDPPPSPQKTVLDISKNPCVWQRKLRGRFLDFKLSPCSKCRIFFFWAIPRRLNFICRRFGTSCTIFIGGVNRKNNGTTCLNTLAASSRLLVLLTPPVKMEQTERSETSIYKIQTPGIHPKESMQQRCSW